MTARLSLGVRADSAFVRSGIFCEIKILTVYKETIFKKIILETESLDS